MTLCAPGRLREIADSDFERAGQAVREALRDAADENERLQDINRRSLAIADERAIEAVKARAESERLRADRETYNSWAAEIKIGVDALRADNERLLAALKCERETGICVMVHDPERPPCTVENCSAMRALNQQRSDTEKS